MEVSNPQWSKTSIELLSDPENISLWEKLIKNAEYNKKQGLNKGSSSEAIELLRVSYTTLLEKFPLLFNYWIRYAEWEFKLGNTLKAELVYEKSLHYLSYSTDIWLSYLNFKISTINTNVPEILGIFERARKMIGNHFHAFEFYQLYLRFLQDYESVDPSKFKLRYFILYRIIIEIPLYHYEHFFKSFMDIISEIGQMQNNEEFQGIITCLIPMKDLPKYSALGPKAIAISLKKTFIDIYITTQYKVYEIYAFEKAFTRQYFDVKLLSQQQQDKWDLYIDYLKLKNYPEDVVTLNFERCLIITASYPRFWIKYANYFISSRQYLVAIEVLNRGYSLSNHYKLLIKLVDINIVLENYAMAKDLLVSYLKNNVSCPIPVYEKLIGVERILSSSSEAHLLDLFKEIILETSNDWFFEHVLLYSSISNEGKLSLFKDLETFKDSPVYKASLEKLTRTTSSTKYDFISTYNNEMDSYA